MLYRPNFCAECGEKVERERWMPWTSRSFCANCEPDLRSLRIAPVAVGGVMLFLGGIFFSGLGSKNEPKIAEPIALTASAARNDKTKPAQLKGSDPVAAVTAVAAEEQKPGQTEAAVAKGQSQVSENAKTSEPLTNAAKPLAADLTAVEPAFYCGARTRSGKPCSRKVKTAARCWQHLGKEAILPPEKLIASQQ